MLALCPTGSKSITAILSTINLYTLGSYAILATYPATPLRYPATTQGPGSQKIEGAAQCMLIDLGFGLQFLEGDVGSL